MSDVGSGSSCSMDLISKHLVAKGSRVDGLLNYCLGAQNEDRSAAPGPPDSPYDCIIRGNQGKAQLRLEQLELVRASANPSFPLQRRRGPSLGQGAVTGQSIPWDIYDAGNK